MVGSEIHLLAKNREQLPIPFALSVFSGSSVSGLVNPPSGNGYLVPYGPSFRSLLRAEPFDTFATKELFYGNPKWGFVGIFPFLSYFFLKLRDRK